MTLPQSPTVRPAADAGAPGPPDAATGNCPRYTAVIDIGSGSARAVVMQVNPGGGIEIITQQRVSLNLMSHLNAAGALDPAGIAGALDALEDFALVARAYGIKTIHAVGTAALRESSNAATITNAAAQRFGIPLQTIDGDAEAAYCFIGAIHGLPVANGLLADIGGGSMEIVRFADRTLQDAVSLPLGSLRIANRFALTDRPAPDAVRAATAYVRAILAEAAVPRLSGDAALVGSGGSVRLLSRLTRSLEPYPIIKIHGYRITAPALAAQAKTLAQTSGPERRQMDGMNPERSHSIVGGAVAAYALAQHTAADDGILVSGQGLREGLARHPAPLPASVPVSVPPLAAVRKAALDDLARRFAPRFSRRGKRRAALAGAIAAAAWPAGPPPIAAALHCAALLLDIGDAVDYYNRLNRTASIIVRTDLPGFTHRESAQIAAVLLAAENCRLPRRFRKSRLLPGNDAHLVRQAAVILTLADQLDGRLPPELPAGVVQAGRKSGTLTITTPGWSPAAAPDIRTRWPAAFGENIRIARGEQ